MGSKKTGATITTIVVAVLAIAATLFLLFKMSEDRAASSIYNFNPDDALLEEMETNATRLVKNNYEVFKIYLQKGLPHEKEPYNNVPEDGYYTVSSDTYKDFAAVKALVDETFVSSEAERIISSANNGQVYAQREDGSLGINVNCIDETGTFKAIKYDKSWAHTKILTSPVSNTECSLKIKLSALSDTSGTSPSAAESTSTAAGESTTTASDASLGSDSSVPAGENSADFTITATMKKVNGKWVLEKLVY